MHEWVLSGCFDADIPDNDKCYYRLYTNHTMNVFLHALRAMLEEYGTIGGYVRATAHDGFSAVAAITAFFAGRIPRRHGSVCVCFCVGWYAAVHP